MIKSDYLPANKYSGGNYKMRLSEHILEVMGRRRVIDLSMYECALASPRALIKISFTAG